MAWCENCYHCDENGKCWNQNIKGSDDDRYGMFVGRDSACDEYEPK